MRPLESHCHLLSYLPAPRFSFTWHSPPPTRSLLPPSLVGVCSPPYFTGWRYLLGTILFPKQYTREGCLTFFSYYLKFFLCYITFEIKVIDSVYTTYAVIYNVFPHIIVTFALLAKFELCNENVYKREFTKNVRIKVINLITYYAN